MEFTKEKPDCTFALPDKITVRQQLAYFSASSSVDQAQFLERSWEGAKAIIIPQSWKCAIMPDMNADLDDLIDRNTLDRPADELTLRRLKKRRLLLRDRGTRRQLTSATSA